MREKGDYANERREQNKHEDFHQHLSTHISFSFERASFASSQIFRHEIHSQFLSFDPFLWLSDDSQPGQYCTVSASFPTTWYVFTYLLCLFVREGGGGLAEVVFRNLLWFQNCFETKQDWWMICKVWWFCKVYLLMYLLTPAPSSINIWYQKTRLYSRKANKPVVSVYMIAHERCLHVLNYVCLFVIRPAWWSYFRA